MLPEVVGTEVLLARVAFAKLVCRAEMLTSDNPVGSRLVGKVHAAVATYIVLGIRLRRLLLAWIGNLDLRPAMPCPISPCKDQSPCLSQNEMSPVSKRGTVGQNSETASLFSDGPGLMGHRLSSPRMARREMMRATGRYRSTDHERGSLGPQRPEPSLSATRPACC